MSETVRDYGFIAKLKNPVEDAERLAEKLLDADSNLAINYAGNIVFINYNTDQDIYGLTIGNASFTQEMRDEFIAEAKKYDLVVDEDSITTFDCIWYNGSDNPVSLLTPEEL